MALRCFMSSVRSYKIALIKDTDEKVYRLSVLFNPNEFIQGYGVILAFENDKFALPSSDENKNTLDKSKIILLSQNTEFWIDEKEAIDLFLPMLKLNSEVVIYFDCSSFKIYGVEVTR